jgi:hypothetical protein
MLPVARYPLHATRCTLPVARYPLRATRCTLPATHCAAATVDRRR